MRAGAGARVGARVGAGVGVGWGQEPGPRGAGGGGVAGGGGSGGPHTCNDAAIIAIFELGPGSTTFSTTLT